MREINGACPCGSAINFDVCCKPIIEGAPAQTPEALMRSRYTAYAVGALQHVAATHAEEVRADFNRAEAERLARECEFQKLDIRKVILDGESATMDFVIHFRRDGEDMIQAELATFRREAERWLYAGGDLNTKVTQRIVTRIGRNDPCLCGSGKKAKKCCGTTIGEE